MENLDATIFEAENSLFIAKSFQIVSEVCTVLKSQGISSNFVTAFIKGGFATQRRKYLSFHIWAFPYTFYEKSQFKFYVFPEFSITNGKKPSCIDCIEDIIWKQMALRSESERLHWIYFKPIFSIRVLLCKKFFVFWENWTKFLWDFQKY